MVKLISAKTPPKGWNSWDCFGASVTEAEVRKNAEVVAHKLKEEGWDYIVVDIQWYEEQANSSIYNDFFPVCLNEYSQLIPATNRFPSSVDGAGFKPLADYIHSLGLKFGIHIMRGISREAVHRNLGLEGTTKRAREIALNNICPWNSDMYGVNVAIPEGQLYYDTLMALYASWGVDFIKVDDIAASKLYGGHLQEIAAIRQAIDKTGREIVLSLSPGPASLEDGAFLQKNANMWRLTDDFWDTWPQLLDMFERCEKWAPFIQKGSWPDCDMLPLGKIGIRSVDGGASERSTRFTQDEQQTMLTLWSIFQSPLMYGGDLTQLDEQTLSLLTNQEVNQMHQELTYQEQLYRDETWIIWQAGSPQANYYGVFNISEQAAEFHVERLPIIDKTTEFVELWQKQQIKVSEKILVQPHAALLLKVID